MSPRSISTRPICSSRTANVKAAELNLNYTNIVSPVDGTVVSRNVDVGQTVAASFQTPTLFLIAQDLTKMQVDSNASESDIGYVKEGQKATFRVDAFPDRDFEGDRQPGSAGADHGPERGDLRRGGERGKSRAAAEARDDGQREYRDGVESPTWCGFRSTRCALRRRDSHRLIPRRWMERRARRLGSGCSTTARSHRSRSLPGSATAPGSKSPRATLQAGDRVVTDEVRTAGSHSSGSGSHAGGGMGGGGMPHLPH